MSARGTGTEAVVIRGTRSWTGAWCGCDATAAPPMLFGAEGCWVRGTFTDRSWGNPRRPERTVRCPRRLDSFELGAGESNSLRVPDVLGRALRSVVRAGGGGGHGRSSRHSTRPGFGRTREEDAAEFVTHPPRSPRLRSVCPWVAPRLASAGGGVAVSALFGSGWVGFSLEPKALGSCGESARPTFATPRRAPRWLHPSGWAPGVLPFGAGRGRDSGSPSPSGGGLHRSRVLAARESEARPGRFTAHATAWEGDQGIDG